MGVRILYDGEQELATLYCSTSDWAFGSVFTATDDHGADERLEAFLRWLGAREPRRMTDTELAQAVSDWRSQEAAQWQREEGGEPEDFYDFSAGEPSRR